MAIVILTVVGVALGLLSGGVLGHTAAGLIGLLLAFAAPVIILRRILSSPTITVRLVLGALAIYLLVGLTYAYLYPVIGVLSNEPFFLQTPAPAAIDYLYFSYVTLTTVGYGDFTAATSAGRMFAVSEALVGQLYLVPRLPCSSATSAGPSSAGRPPRASDGRAARRRAGLGPDGRRPGLSGPSPSAGSCSRLTGRQAGRSAAYTSVGPRTPLSSTGPTSRNATAVPAASSTTAWLTKTSPAFA